MDCLQNSVADPKQKFRVLFRIRIQAEVSFGFGSRSETGQNFFKFLSNLIFKHKKAVFPQLHGLATNKVRNKFAGFGSGSETFISYPDPAKIFWSRSEPDPQHWSQASIRGSGSRSTPKCHGSGTMSRTLNCYTNFRNYTTTLKEEVPLLATYESLKIQFDWITDGGISRVVEENLSRQIEHLELYLRWIFFVFCSVAEP